MELILVLQTVHMEDNLFANVLPSSTETEKEKKNPQCKSKTGR